MISTHTTGPYSAKGKMGIGQVHNTVVNAASSIGIFINNLFSKLQIFCKNTGGLCKETEKYRGAGGKFPENPLQSQIRYAILQAKYIGMAYV